MSKTVTTTVSVTLAGDGFGGSPLLNLSSQNPFGVAPQRISLAAGNNPVAVPAGAAGVVLVPSPGLTAPNTVAWTVKGVNGDTGIAPAPAGWVAFSLTPGALASFVVNAASPMELTAVWQ